MSQDDKKVCNKVAEDPTKISQETYDKLMVIAEKWGIKDISFFKYLCYSWYFLVTLEADTSAIGQGCFEEEAMEILCKTRGRVFTITLKGLDKSVETCKITNNEKEKIIKDARPLKQYIIG